MTKTNTILRSSVARTIVGSRHRSIGTLATLLFVGSLIALMGFATDAAAQSSSSPGLFIADFNHDGVPDVLVPSPATSSFTLNFGSVPFGTFSATARSVPYPAGCTAVVAGDTVVADFNGDGFADIAVACTHSPSTFLSYTIYVLLGVGDGSFVTAPSFTGLSKLVAGDFNKDGKQDLVATGATGHSDGQFLYFFAGLGDGTFATAVSTRISNTVYSAVLPVDIDQDGYTDLAFGNFSSQTTNTVDAFRNNQDGTFGQAGDVRGPSLSIAVGAYPASNDVAILTGNFFGSGLPDLAVVDTGTSPGVFVIQNNSTDGFSSAGVTKIAAPGLLSAATASFTSAFSDLLVYDGAKLTVLANDGTGNFAASYAGLAAANATTLYAAADANADGHADIYTAALNATGAALTVDLVSGSASASSVAFPLPAGSTPVSAVWSGNIDFAGSTANGTQIVNAIATAVSLTSSKNPALVGESITFTATVAPAVSGNATATGTVTFYDGTKSLGSPALGAGGIATLTSTTLAAGTHQISVSYSGDSIFAASSLAAPLAQQVNSRLPIITWPTPPAIVYGTALSGTQLDATAATSTGVNIPGTFAYSPAAGTVLSAGQQTLTVTFTPTDLVNYTTATGTVSLLVNQAVPLLNWTPTVSNITYGTALGAQQLNATATGAGSTAISGAFTYTPASGTVLGAGPQTLSVLFTPSDVIDYTVARATAQIAVGKATPVITWPTPAAIAYGIPLGASQLDATAAGVGNTTLPGSFVYTPAAGAVLTPGEHTLSAAFTPTDVVNYAAATASVTLNVTDILLSSFTPNTAQLGDPDKTITITGSGFVATTVAQVNGTSIATTLVSPTSLTAIIPAAYFAAPGTLQITLKNPATGSVSGALPFTVSAPPVTGTLTGPPTSAPGSQPVLNFSIPAYPVDLTATLTLSLKSSLASGVTDSQNVVFSNGESTFTFVIKAGTTTIPAIQLQAGTVAETITVTPTLSVDGVDVTPAGLGPVVIDVPAAVPSATTTSLTRVGDKLVISIIGFSNTREIVQAHFHFVPAAGAALESSDFTPTVADTFASWYALPDSLSYGSSFTYTQEFGISGGASQIGSVQVTLTNSVGVSTTYTAQ